jgi:hypothetical protein
MFIVLTFEQKETYCNKLYNGWFLYAAKINDDCFVLPIGVLENPVYSEIHNELAKLPTSDKIVFPVQEGD